LLASAINRLVLPEGSFLPPGQHRQSTTLFELEDKTNTELDDLEENDKVMQDLVERFRNIQPTQVERGELSKLVVKDESKTGSFSPPQG